MKNLLRWVISNSPAMNTLMVAILVVGSMSFYFMHREIFPEFQLEIIVVTVPFPGASPEEVEEGICQKIEENVQGISGIKKLYSVANEGMGAVILEMESSVNVQRAFNEVRNEVDRIPSFPVLAENKTVQQITIRAPAIYLAVLAPNQETADTAKQLRTVAESIREHLLRSKSINNVEILGARNYQIDVEISESTLRKYNLTLADVANRLRQRNIEMPGGTMRTESQEILIRSKNKGFIGEEIERIPLLTTPSGGVLTVGEIGTVRDEFTDETAISRINGKPGLIVSINKTPKEDLIAITDEVKNFAVNVAPELLPPGYTVEPFSDNSTFVRDRLNLLIRNGWQGMFLVFILLALFLDLKLAFWVAMGVPISVLGGGIFLYGMGTTMNMLSMFAFIMVLGILVDDAIIVGENIYHHRLLGKDFFTAAVDGTYEVAASVVSAVLTTVIAFIPILFVPGIMGKFFAVIPVAVIVLLLFSLFECLFILPVHLAHQSHEYHLLAKIRRMPGVFRFTLGYPILFIGLTIHFFTYPFKRLLQEWKHVNRFADKILHLFIHYVYEPLVRLTLRYPAILVTTCITVLLLFAGGYEGGLIKFTLFPKTDAPAIVADLAYPDGTPASITEETTMKLERAIRDVNEDYIRETGKPVIKMIQTAIGNVSAASRRVGNERSDGSHRGKVLAEMVDTRERTVPSMEVLNRWREKAGEFPGVEALVFGSDHKEPGGKMFEVKLLIPKEKMPVLEEAIDIVQQKLATYKGVFDISTNLSPGKWEFQTKIKPRAVSLGITDARLGDLLRDAFYGNEVMRLQRGRHEVKLMVRYPKEERDSIGSFEDIRYRLGDSELPISELAEINVQRGYSQINRSSQKRSITISADVDPTLANATEIVADMKNNFLPYLLYGKGGPEQGSDDFRAIHDPRYADIEVSWEGQQEQMTESIDGLTVGFSIAIVAIFVLLTLEFKSYLQPAIIMAIIPFSILGAVLGHAVMRMEVTLLSLFGMVALIGVVINDSIVLIDYINRTIEKHPDLPIKDVLIRSGRRRLRPVMLTTLTTVAGLTPLILEKSFQAQFLIPMAVSLCFGLIASTSLVLVMVPTLYYLYYYTFIKD